MGITGLLPMLKKASANCNVRKFSGCTVAIDAYCWLHKGAFGCAAQLGKGEPTTAYINYCVKYINVLLSHNIKPILVLDGRNLPSKSETEKKRRQKREENRKNAQEYLRKGMNKEAWECFTRCVDITPAMAREFIKVLRNMKIDYIIAPYEADAQLAYLARNKIVDIVITEDSDLVLFGCPKIFFKMTVNGDGVLFDQSKIPNCVGLKPDKFNFERFRWMCIMSGCDYLASLPGIGLGRAKKVIEGTTTHDIPKVLKSIPKLLGLDIQVPQDYINKFIQAELTFLHQLVFDTISKRLVPLTPYSADIDKDMLHYAGAYIDSQLALDMALGNVDIKTLEKVDSFDINHPSSGYTHNSIWSPNFTIPTTTRLITARDMKNNTTHSSTIGMKAMVSVSSVIKKRNRVEVEQDTTKNEKDDQELLSLYACKSNGDLPSKSETDEFQDGIEPGCDERNVSKRRRISLQASFEGDEEACTKEDFPKEISPTNKTRRTPFLKVNKTESTSYLLTEERREVTKKNPICLVEKNKIYEEEFRVIVKSQYFREEESSLPKATKSVKSNFRLQLNEDETDEIVFPEKTDSEAAGDLDSQDSQLTIYSICSEEEFEESETFSEPASLKSSNEGFGNNSENNTPTAVQVITLENEEDSEDISSTPRTNEIKSRLRNMSFLSGSNPNSSQRSPKKSTTMSKPKKLIGPCNRVGLSKTALRKVDPKQKTISSMFGFQQKPKM